MKQEKRWPRKITNPCWTLDLGFVNYRKMEENIWSAPEVFQLMDKELVLVSLYVDDRTPLQKEQFKFEQSNGAVITINNREEVGKFSIAQPIDFTTFLCAAHPGQAFT